MSPALLQVLEKVKLSLKLDLDELEHIMSRKKEEYIKVASMIYHMNDNLEAMQAEHTEKLVINCDPPDVDDEGRLI